MTDKPEHLSSEAVTDAEIECQRALHLALMRLESDITVRQLTSDEQIGLVRAVLTASRPVDGLREGEALEAIARLNNNLSCAPADAEKCFVSLDDHRTLVAAFANRPACGGLDNQGEVIALLELGGDYAADVFNEFRDKESECALVVKANIERFNKMVAAIEATRPTSTDYCGTASRRVDGLLEDGAFQARVQPWMMACFGPAIAADKLERNDRFIEEALELVQASGYDQTRAHALVDYVYGRPQGDIKQEVGGVMVTLAAHCLAHGVDMHEAAETELSRIWTKVEQIRAKQAAKPTGSALPVARPDDAEQGLALEPALVNQARSDLGPTGFGQGESLPCSEGMIESANEILREMFAETAILLTYPDKDRCALAKERIYALLFPAVVDGSPQGRDGEARLDAKHDSDGDSEAGNRTTPMGDGPGEQVERELHEARATIARVRAALDWEPPTSEAVKTAIATDLSAGLSLRKCAEKHGVTLGIVRGVAAIEATRPTSVEPT